MSLVVSLAKCATSGMVLIVAITKLNICQPDTVWPGKEFWMADILLVWQRRQVSMQWCARQGLTSCRRPVFAWRRPSRHTTCRAAPAKKPSTFGPACDRFILMSLMSADVRKGRATITSLFALSDDLLKKEDNGLRKTSSVIEIEIKSAHS